MSEAGSKYYQTMREMVNAVRLNRPTGPLCLWFTPDGSKEKKLVFATYNSDAKNMELAEEHVNRKSRSGEMELRSE